jgi:iron-sulfur cluster protein
VSAISDSPAKTPALETPRAVANKSDKSRLLRAIRMSLAIESPAVRRNTQAFNTGRYAATALLPDYDALKDQARAIKDKSIAALPELIQTLKNSVRSRGGHVFVSTTAEDACRYILDVCRWRAAKLVIKGKTITSEEIRLNHVLQNDGIEVVESDLAEFILQVADEQPSHFIGPALHYSRERITALFKRKFKTDQPLDTGEALTQFAREKLRDKFLYADIGITGANLIAADTGTLMLVESEGNIRMASYLPPVHIAIAGVEKIIPTRAEMAPFVELLAASATGQSLAAYTSFLSPPLTDPIFLLPGKPAKAREFHLVLIDNGRMRMREDAVLRETLNCIRCGACLNSCANFQTVGGHAFGGESYSGGIGGAWEAGTGKLENARFSELCTGCTRCVNQCPVRIDIPWLNANLAERLNQQAAPTPLSHALGSVTSAADEDRTAPAGKIFFGNYHYFAKWGARMASLAHAIGGTKLAELASLSDGAGRARPLRAAMERWVGLDRRRNLPVFPKQTLVQAAQKLAAGVAKPKAPKAVLFADVFTNYGLAQRGVVTIELLRALGVDIVVSESVPEGRAALSQGMITTAKGHAKRAAIELDRYVSEGRDIVVVEPSSLAMFRRDMQHLFESKERFERFRSRAFDPVEYVIKVLEKTSRKPTDIFDAARSPVGPKIFFHAHCQQKTIGAAAPTEKLLREVGFDVLTSNVECCGMAGSFGYKADYYDLSMAVGADLFTQITQQERSGGKRALIASGTSCTEQLHAGFDRAVMHPIELLAAILKK